MDEVSRFRSYSEKTASNVHENEGTRLLAFVQVCGTNATSRCRLFTRLCIYQAITPGILQNSGAITRGGIDRWYARVMLLGYRW